MWPNAMYRSVPPSRHEHSLWGSLFVPFWFNWAIGNLARSLATANARQLQADLTCYARSVVNVEFPAIEAGNTSQLDDDSALLRVYHSVSSLRLGSQNEVATAQAVTKQLSTLTDARDARIRAARSSLPLLLWLVVAVGGAVIVLAVAAAT